MIIVGAGITGLAVAHEIRRRAPDATVTVLEASGRAGGLIGTTVADGYLLEWGPEAIQGSSKETLDLLSDLGLGEKIVKATPKARTRYVVHRGVVTPLPIGPRGALGTRLLSPTAKLRAAMEVLVGPGNGEESVAQFGRRRFGPAVAPLVDAVVTGLFAGDPEELSLDVALPQLRWLESSHGSVIKGMMKERGPGARSLPLLTLEGGMETLVRALANGTDIRFGAQVGRVQKANCQVRVITGDRSEAAEVVVLAGGPSMAHLLDGPRISTPKVREAPVAVVGLGYDASVADERSQGYGFLSPEDEGRFVLGVLYTSSLFPEHAPEGRILYRCLVGGIRHPERARLSDAELIGGCQGDLRALLGVEGEPEFTHVVRHGRGIPQLEMGHRSVISAVRQLEKEVPGLYIEGTGCSGISTNHLIGKAKALAKRIVADRLRPG